MTATPGKICDVFISHAASDTQLAKEIADSLRSAALEPFYSGTVEPGMDLADSIWQALAESRALIVIVSPDVPPSPMGLVEIGAAAAWNHPVFILLKRSLVHEAAFGITPVPGLSSRSARGSHSQNPHWF